MGRRGNRQAGFTDTSVVLKLFGLAVIIAVVTCCNRWVKSSVMRQNGYVEADPNEPPPDAEQERGFVVQRGGLR